MSLAATSKGAALRRALILIAALGAAVAIFLIGGAGGASAAAQAQIGTTTSTPTASPSANITEGQSITLTTTVTAASGSTAPTGTVTFAANYGGQQVTLGPGSGAITLTPISSTQSQATLTTNGLQTGTYDITAIYSPDNPFAFAGSNSPSASPLVVTVSSQIVSTTIHFIANPITIHAGDLITFTAQVTASDGSIPTGAISFTSGTGLGPDAQTPLYGIPNGYQPVTLDSTGTAVTTAGGWRTGTYYVVAGYPGNGVDAPVNGYVLVTVLPAQGTQASAISYTGDVQAVHGTQATLSAVLASPAAGPIGNESVTLTMGNESCTAISDTFGIASCPITVNDAPGNYTVTAAFGGDSAWTASSTSAPFTVLPLSTNIVPASGSGGSGLPATLSARLTDGGGNPLAGQTVTLALPDESCTATTDSNGNASCTVTVGESAGAYSVTASFAGAGLYGPVSATAPFTVPVRPSATSAASVSVGYGAPATVSAQVTDSGTGTGLAGKTVTLSAGTQSCTPTSPTGADGTVSCTIPSITQTPGTYTITASFAGDSSYSPSSGTGTLTVTKIATTTTYTGDTLGLPGGTVTLSSHLVTAGGPLAGKPASISVDGVSACTGTTDANGNISCAGLAAPSAGPHTITASFAGDAIDAASSASGQLIIGKLATTTTYTGATQGVPGTTATLSAHLILAGGGPLAGKTVTISLGSAASCTGTTDANGNVTCTVTTPAAGTYAITASFAGDTIDAASSATGTFVSAAFAGTITCGGSVKCESLLADPSPAANGTVTGSTVTLVYTDDDPYLASNPPTAALSNGQALPITLTSTSGQPQNYVDSNGGSASTKYQTLLTITLPAGLANGNYRILVTIHDGDGDVDQWAWPIVIGPGGGGGGGGGGTPGTATSITTNFNGTAVPAGDTLWFSNVLKVAGIPATGATITFTGQTITMGSTTISVPNAQIVFSPTATTATTTFSGGMWVTTVPAKLGGNMLVSGVAYQLASALAGNLKNVTWSANVSSDTKGVSVNWQWGAAAYSSFGSTPNVKPVDDGKASVYQNGDHAGTPEAYKASVVAGALGSGGTNYTGNLAPAAQVKF